MVKLFVENGADTAYKDHDDQTALGWAAVGCHSESVMSFLLEKGADISNQDKDGRTCLHWALGGVMSRWLGYFWKMGSMFPPAIVLDGLHSLCSISRTRKNH